MDLERNVGDTSPAQPSTAIHYREAEAFMVWKAHGERAPVHVAERIGTLALAGDAAGVDRWKAIAASLDGLMRAARS